MKELIKKSLQRFGIRIQRADTPMRTLEEGFAHLSTKINPRTIVDVGVAHGTKELYNAYPPHNSYQYVLIEADPHFELGVLKNKLGADVFTVFCGDREGEIKFNSASTNKEFSSAYTPLKKRETTELSIPTKTLDSILKTYHAPFLIKIDVEGAELDVLRGAQKTLEKTDALVVEVSVSPRFENAPELSDVVCFLKDKNFAVFDILSGSNKNGNLNLVDLVFVKKDAHFR